MTIFLVRHQTKYRYRKPVRLGEHRLMFRPRDSFDQRLLESHLEITPNPASMRWIHDLFGNCVTIFDFDGVSSAHLEIESIIRLDHTPESAPDFQIEDYARVYPFKYRPHELPDLTSCMQQECRDPEGELIKWLRRFLNIDRKQPTGRLLMTLNQGIADGFSYARRSVQNTQTPIETLRSGKGSCRDFALLLIEAARALGFAARFVSGYIYVPDRDGPTWHGGGSTHAWCQVYLPGSGWVEFDPTNGIVGNRDLIRVAVARQPEQAIPLSGVYWGDRSDELGMDVVVNVKSLERLSSGSHEDENLGGTKR